jgi:hypothetical protein
MRLNIKDLRKFDGYSLSYHGGVAYLYRSQFGRSRRGKHGWLPKTETMWLATWMSLWPKNSYEVLAMAELKQ